jgi:DNA-binding MarR family transcriptional regulator
MGTLTKINLILHTTKLSTTEKLILITIQENNISKITQLSSITGYTYPTCSSNLIKLRKEELILKDSTDILYLNFQKIIDYV